MGALARIVCPGIVVLVVAAGALAATRADAAAPPADVAALQVALRARGLYAGAVDGIAGPATAGAGRAFQAAGGRGADGAAAPAPHTPPGGRGAPPLRSRAITAGMRGWD